MIPESRLKHSYSVGKKMEELAISRGWSQEVQQDLYTLGLNHDIGYEFMKEGENHAYIGGEILRRSGYQYWREVYYHAGLQDEYESDYLDILMWADMQIDKDGNDVGFDERLEDIKSRYYYNHPEVYEKCVQMVEHVRNMY